jgi:hypothetical protein
MWRIDHTQHIHVDANIREAEVLLKATAVAQQSTNGAPLVLDLWPLEAKTCACEVPSGWKTYQVLLYVAEPSPSV